MGTIFAAYGFIALIVLVLSAGVLGVIAYYIISAIRQAIINHSHSRS